MGAEKVSQWKERYKDIEPGTMALLTLLRGTSDQADMIHVGWRTMDHEQPSDVMTLEEAAEHFNVV